MRNRNLILLLLLIAALLPYFIISFYAMPFADDFCFGWTASEKIPFAQKFLNQYLLWNGRYSADILVNLHPLITGSLLIYQLSLFASLVATTGVVFIFIRRFVPGNIRSLLATLLFVLFYLCYLPNLTEGVYWYIGISNYLLGNLCFLLQLVSIAKANSAPGNKKMVWLAASVILLIIAIGFNEIAAFLVPLYYLGACIINLRIKKTHQQSLALLFVFAIISAAFLALSPGNDVRANEAANSGNLLSSLFYSSLQTIRFIGKWSLSVPFVVLSCMVIANAHKIAIGLPGNIDYKIILAALLFTVFAGSFLPYFATDMLGQHRTINYVFFYFIFLWIWLLTALSEKYELQKKLLPLLTANRQFALAIICILTMAATGNGGRIICDFSRGKFIAYDQEFAQRQSQILSNTGAVIPCLKTVPETFTIVDVTADSSQTYWVDKCMAEYYTTVKLNHR